MSKSKKTISLYVDGEAVYAAGVRGFYYSVVGTESDPIAVRLPDDSKILNGIIGDFVLTGLGKLAVGLEESDVMLPENLSAVRFGSVTYDKAEGTVELQLDPEVVAKFPSLLGRFIVGCPVLDKLVLA